LVDGGAGDSAVVKGKSYEYHVLAGVSGPGNFDLYIDAHLNGGSAGVTESSSSSGKVKSKKTQAEVLVAQVSPGLYCPPPPSSRWQLRCSPPPSLYYNFSWLGIAPTNINLHYCNAIKFGSGNAEQRGCVVLDTGTGTVRRMPVRLRYSTLGGHLARERRSSHSGLRVTGKRYL
jgi:hypothetical protein